ncbi:MAG TPA: NAD(P)-dependent oxidoreductase [Thermoanaerobaculia bacterium]|nr:NAD(P)-dependent oxidoreductase [Thermoanaerobaculia bacterium]
MNIGFIGLGRMGTGMAESLLRAGHQVTVYNRTPEKARPLAERGARVASSVGEVCAQPVVFTMLADDPALEAVAYGEEGMLRRLKRGALHASSSTVSVELSARLARDHAAAGQRYVAAPVFGRPEAAAAAKLSVVAAGDAAAIAEIRPLFDALGPKTFVVSDRPETANLVKLSGNFLLASVIESLGEAFALVGKGGVDRRQYLHLLTSSLFDVPVYKNYGRAIADRAFTPAGFAAPLGQKDIRLTLAAAETLRVPMPIASLLRDRFLALLARGGESLDWSAVGDLARQDAGERAT